ncbi:MAG: glycoside hydrolase family 2 [Armatimonadetes bacterium]|nr:glycoside hydrolase family 2 [Armatimonadota bacterium]
MSDHSLPRPEHPRPDWQRGKREGRDWVNLNGTWQFDFDPEGVGEAEGWERNHAFGDRIVVPFGWESHLAWGDEDRAGNEDYFSPKAFLEPERVTPENYLEARRHETGWYRRSVEVPARWQSERVYLCCGAIDYFAKVWVNGQLLCETESGYTPLEVDLTDQVRFGEANDLVIRAHDPNDHEQQPVGKQTRWYARTSGIWQTVWLEPRGAVHLAGASFATDIESGEVTCSIRLSGPPGGDLGFRLAVSMPEGGTAYNTWGVKAEAGAGPHETRLTVHEPRLWSPDDPFLYPVTLELLDGAATLDLVQTYFAFREVRIKALPDKTTRYVHLNGRPVYLLGALDQSLNPWGVYTFPTDEAIRRDVELAREAGFNFLRIHIKAEDPRLLYWADRLGMLIMADLPNVGYGGYSSLACGRWERTLRAVIARDANHPSIIAWCLFNETWGLGGDEYRQLPDRQAWVRRMLRLAHALDPTRPIEDNSPCLYDHVETDLNSWHFYLNDYAAARAHIAEVVEQTHPGSGFNYCPGCTQNREPLLNSEYGGISARMGDLDVSWCFHFLTNELRLHERICGYVYTELQDIEWERNGVYNYDRTPKEFGYDLRELNRPDFLALDAPPCQVVRPGQEVIVPAFASHFGKFVGDHATLGWKLELLDHTGRVEEFTGAERRTPFPRFAVTPAGKISATMPDRPGLVTLHAWLRTAAGEPIAHNWLHFHVLGEAPADGRLLIPLSAFAGPGLQAFEVDGAREAVWIEGAGVLTATVPVPGAVREPTSLAFVVEVSSCRPGGGGRQTDADRWPSRVRISLAGVDLGEVELPDHPADSRGVLSHYYGFAGRYGELVRLEVPAERVPATLEALRGGAELRLAVDADLPGGVSVYGSRSGRYPTGPCVVLT